MSPREVIVTVTRRAAYCIAQLSKSSADAEKSGSGCVFFQCLCGVLSAICPSSSLRTKSRSLILLQRGITILDREAAALPGRFLPELGRSSERPFFLPRSFGLWVRRAIARVQQGTRRSALLPSDQNLWGKAGDESEEETTRPLRAARRACPAVTAGSRSGLPSHASGARAPIQTPVAWRCALHPDRANG